MIISQVDEIVCVKEALCKEDLKVIRRETFQRAGMTKVAVKGKPQPGISQVSYETCRTQHKARFYLLRSTASIISYVVHFCNSNLASPPELGNTFINSFLDNIRLPF